jgi:large subunit ribosomal protein L9
MKVILLDHVSTLGRKGEVKEVKDGFAQNFLLPQKKAVLATEKNVQKYSFLQKQAEEKKSAVFEPKSIAGRLRSVVLEFTEKADENGTFFAGITKDKLIKELATRGINLKPKQILLAQPIKQAGEHRVEVDIAAGVKSEFIIKTNHSPAA